MRRAPRSLSYPDGGMRCADLRHRERSRIPGSAAGAARSSRACRRRPRRSMMTRRYPSTARRRTCEHSACAYGHGPASIPPTAMPTRRARLDARARTGRQYPAGEQSGVPPARCVQRHPSRATAPNVSAAKLARTGVRAVVERVRPLGVDRVACASTARSHRDRPLDRSRTRSRGRRDARQGTLEGRARPRRKPRKSRRSRPRRPSRRRPMQAPLRRCRVPTRSRLPASASADSAPVTERRSRRRSRPRPPTRPRPTRARRAGGARTRTARPRAPRRRQRRTPTAGRCRSRRRRIQCRPASRRRAPAPASTPHARARRSIASSTRTARAHSIAARRRRADHGRIQHRVPGHRRWRRRQRDCRREHDRQRPSSVAASRATIGGWALSPHAGSALNFVRSFDYP